MKFVGYLAALFVGFVSLHAEPVKGPHALFELIAENSAIEPGVPLTVGVRIQHDPHWHTYWKNPGDAGLATMLTWSLPEGFEAGPVEWPVPERVDIAGLVSYAYLNEVVLLTRLTPPASLKPGTKVSLKVKVDYLICEETCVPGSAQLQLVLPVAKGTAGKNSASSALLEKFRAQLPQAVPASVVRVSATEQAWTLEWDGASTSANFFPAQEQAVIYAGTQTLTVSNNVSRLTVPRNLEGKSTQLQGVLVTDTARWEIDSPWFQKAQEITTPVKPAPASSAMWTLWLALGSAFVGGLILNLMPCVLPVLSLKIFGLMQHAGGDRHVLRQHGLSFTAGVLASFWALAGGLLILRAGGEQLGWGFQLQSPLFVLALIALLFLVSLNLLGVFEVGVSLTGAAAGPSHQGTLRGSFFNGVLATVVATPCTAPFMGTALGFAATQPPALSLLVFTTLGLGMAAPYMLLSTQPAWLKFLPKPGNWMVVFKKALAFPMLATSVWLVQVLGLQTSVTGVTALLIGLLVLSIAALLYGWAQQPIRSALEKGLGYAVALILVLGAGRWTVDQIRHEAAASSSPQSADSEGGLNWEPFSPERLGQLRAENRPVFVDFTAAWCLSCQVNHKVAFGSEEVRAKFREKNIATLKADWTKRDPVITQTLASFGRNGVPLYVLYWPGENQPRILPEVLTPQIVLQALP